MNHTDQSVNAVGVVFEVCGSLFIVLEHLLAIFLILKCRIVQKAIKILVANLCVIDIIAGSWGCIRALLRFSTTDMRRMCMLDILFTTWIFNVSAFLVSAIAIDRYISVFFPMKYTLFVNKRLFTIICCVLWFLGATLATVTELCELQYTNERGCETRMSQQEVFPWILVLLRLFCICIMCYTYSLMYIKIVSLGKLYNDGIKRTEIRRIVKILLIVTPHLIVHFFYIIMFLLKPILLLKNSLSYESLLNTSVMLIDTWIYVFRFKECRLNLAIYVCFFRKKSYEEYMKRRTLLYGTFLQEDNTLRSHDMPLYKY